MGTSVKPIQFSKCGPGISSMGSPGNLLEMGILWPRPKPTEPYTLGLGPSNLCFYQVILVPAQV